MIFREELGRLADQNPGRLKIFHTLTRDNDVARFGPNVRKGRVDQALLREAIGNPEECLVYVCGPGVSKFDLAAAKEAGSPPPVGFLNRSSLTSRGWVPTSASSVSSTVRKRVTIRAHRQDITTLIRV